MKNSNQINKMEIGESKAYKSSLMSFSVVLSVLVMVLLVIVYQTVISL